MYAYTQEIMRFHVVYETSQCRYTTVFASNAQMGLLLSSLNRVFGNKTNQHQHVKHFTTSVTNI